MVPVYGLSLSLFVFCPLIHFLAAEQTISMKFCVVVRPLLRCVLSPLGIISSAASKCRFKKGAEVDNLWPLRHQFSPFDCDYLKNSNT